jgi:pimeloyl-ACP methyl ester carboxylesterase
VPAHTADMHRKELYRARALTPPAVPGIHAHVFDCPPRRTHGPTLRQRAGCGSGAPHGPRRYPGAPASGPGGATRGDLGGGARGGFGRPGQGAYARLAEALRQERISSLRLCYRHPNVLPECALDILAGIAALQRDHVQRIVLVGHSFGGAVIMTAGAVHEQVAGVVALAPAACRFTTGHRNRNSWSCSRALSTAWTNARRTWTSCLRSGFQRPSALQ